VQLSIIMPVLNEAATISATLAALQPLRAQGVQLIVVDGGSSDLTWTLCDDQADSVLRAPRGRAKQMNAGAAQAHGDVLLFLHADTALPIDALADVREAVNAGAQWGRFDVRIDGRSSWLPIIAAFMNGRSRWTGVATGDQAMFLRADLFRQVGGFPDQALMEDIELSKQLRKQAAPACLRATVTTSGRRWDSRGVLRTMLLMWRLRWRYWRGESPDTLAKAYR
jgi:rSAM/selenodomain-associated transferase 2